MKKDFLGFAIVIAMTLIMFSCNKENELELGKTNVFLEHRDLSNDVQEYTVQYELDGIDNEFYEYYTMQHNSIDLNDSITPITPFYFDIDWFSGIQLNVYGDNSMVYELNDGPLESMKYYKNKILFQKASDQTITVKTLTYLADSIFYNETNIEQNDSNFTGIVIESYDLMTEGMMYKMNLGSITETKTYRPTELLSYRDDSKCYQWKESWWKRFWHKVKRIANDIFK